MNFDEEVWLEDPNQVCVISKVTQETQKNPKVDQEAKKGAKDLLVLVVTIQMLLDLNEYNCFHNMRVRYSRQQIYTQIGQAILISINPYKRMPELYNHQTLSLYRSNSSNKEGEPHLFQIAQSQLNQLFEVRGIHERICSMIISGESGSGKTEATKILLKYIASEQTSRLLKSVYNAPTAEEQVLASNPLLEAFGNAKTARNDNSSRFGKFIHLYLNPETRRVSSAKIDNYLLEKVRVVKISKIERNYHIFYQLIAAQIPELKLTSPSQYEYLKYGDLKFQKDDKEEFKLTDQCLDKLCFTGEEKKYIYRTLAGLLHLGNVQISYNSNESSLVDNDTLQLACQFLGISSEQLKGVVCNEFTSVGNQIIRKNNNLDSAISFRDTLAKHIYDKLFNWLIEKTNSQISSINYESDDEGQGSKYMIGILDIFGFEIFTDENGVHTNSFEQLNINFTNEKLQQYFNQHMFIEEQKEYEQEGIEWKQITFPDNKKVIDLIEINIYKMLVDQTITLNRGDKDFLTSLKSLPKEKFFLPQDLLNVADIDPKFDKKVHRNLKIDWFGLKHFGGAVVYNVAGFVEKNRDSINQEVHKTLPESENPIIKMIWKSPPTQLNMKQSNVIARFNASLKELLNLLNRSMPKYIKCIKPNNQKAAFQFDAQDVRRQFMCSGLLEAIRIRKAGYDIRKKNQDFISQYKYLIKGQVFDIKDFFTQLQNNHVFGEVIKRHLENKMFQIGKTKIYMKDTFRDYLDSLLNEYRLQYAIKIKKQLQTFVYKLKILKNLNLLLSRFHKLQRFMKKTVWKKRFQQRTDLRKKQNRFAQILQKAQIKQLKLDYFFSFIEIVKQIKTNEQKKQKKIEQLRDTPSDPQIQGENTNLEFKEQIQQQPEIILQPSSSEVQEQVRKETAVNIDKSKDLVHQKEIEFYQNKLAELQQELSKEKLEKQKLEENYIQQAFDLNQNNKQVTDSLNNRIEQLETQLNIRDQTINDLNMSLNDQINKVNSGVENLETINNKLSLLEIQYTQLRRKHTRSQRLIKAMNQGIKLKNLEIDSIHKHLNIKTQEQKLALYQKFSIKKLMESSDLLMKQIQDQYQELQQLNYS